MGQRQPAPKAQWLAAVPGSAGPRAGEPGRKTYVVALALALLSAFLFGMVPVRQVLRADPYEIVKSGIGARLGRRITTRDVLLGVQIAICAVLVTSSMVAVRGLVRSLTAIGFRSAKHDARRHKPGQAGYSGDQVPAMQKRMIEAMRTIPGVERVGLVKIIRRWSMRAGSRANVFTDERRICARRTPLPCRTGMMCLPDISRPRGQPCYGPDFTWHDEKNAPPVAVVNREFAGTMFGSVASALGAISSCRMERAFRWWA